MKQKIRISREKSLSILALEGIGSIGSIIAGRLEHWKEYRKIGWKGCRKIGRLEAMQEDWKAGRDAGRLEGWKGCRKIGRLEAMQEDWKARRDAGTLEHWKGCRKI